MKIMRYLEATLLKNSSFAIVSDNCWGYSIYKTLGREYNTPFVGLYMQPDHYLKALSNLDGFLSHNISQIGTKAINGLTFPVAATESGIEINFMHYPDFNHAKALWQRRAERLLEHRSRNLPTRFKFCDREGAMPDQISQFFLETKGAGVAFSAQSKKIDSMWLQTPTPKDGVALYRDRYLYMDFIQFLSSGEIKKTPKSVMASLLGRQ